MLFLPFTNLPPNLVVSSTDLLEILWSQTDSLKTPGMTIWFGSEQFLIFYGSFQTHSSLLWQQVPSHLHLFLLFMFFKTDGSSPWTTACPTVTGSGQAPSQDCSRSLMTLLYYSHFRHSCLCLPIFIIWDSISSFI